MMQTRLTPRCRALIATVFACILAFAAASGASYKIDEPISIWANKIGPYSSPTESYGYFDAMPWCRPAKLERKALKLGETLAGDRLIKSNYDLKYRTATNNVQICEKTFTGADMTKFFNAVRKRFVYELLIENMPMKLFVGEISDDALKHVYLYTHIDFLISVNGPHIIEAIATPAHSIEIKEHKPTKLRFTYTVKWKDTDFPVTRRAEKYRDPLHSRDVDIHWFSIGNATLSVLLLMGLFGSILLRVVRKDFREYEALDGDDEVDDYGWKLLHGDVFRFPRLLTLLCPILGTGVQLCILSVILLAFGALEFFHPLSRGTIYTTALLSYAATSGVAGFVSGYYYKQMGGFAWVRNALITVFLFCGPVAAIFLYLNTIAVVYGSTRAMPLWTILAVSALWMLVTIPLTIIGAIVGKNSSRPYDSPGRTAKISREIPKSWWYRRPIVVAGICGLMPFSAIYVEVYFMFGAIWGHKIFQVYEMLAIVFGMLMLVTTITTVSAVYFQLTMENYLWAWASVFYGGSIGAYLFGYSIFYYFIASPLTGFLQGNFFFGYMFLVSYAFFLMCGTAGFFSARRFVRFLYSSVKND